MLVDKFITTRRELSESLIERDEEIDLVMTGLVARQHVLLVGPPGTGKTMLARAMAGWMSGEVFSVCLNKYSTPEEIFGPISVMGLKEDRYRRITDNTLVTASFAVVDEIFKASSAISNTLLPVMNEREYRNDGQIVRCKLQEMIACSNEWGDPNGEGKELGALFDRFLLRKKVRPVSSPWGLERLLFERDLNPTLSTSITPEEVSEASYLAQALPISEPASEAMRTILKEVRGEGIEPSDRRIHNVVPVTQAYAWLCGAEQVETDHLEILCHVLWDSPEDQPGVIASIVSRVARPAGMLVNSLLLEATQIVNNAVPSNLSAMALSSRKLSEISSKLSRIKGDKARRVESYINRESERLALLTAATL